MTDTIETPVRFPGRKAQKERTVAKIKAAATTLFTNVGHANATIRGIAKGAGMSTGAVFANWKNKEAIWQEVMGLPSPRDGALYRAGPELLKAVEQACHDAKVRWVRLAQQAGHEVGTYPEAASLYGASNHVAMLEALIAKATTPLPFEVEDAADAG